MERKKQLLQLINKMKNNSKWMKENRNNTMKMVVINSNNKSTMNTTMVLKVLTTVKILETKLKENNNKMIMDKNFKEKKGMRMMI